MDTVFLYRLVDAVRDSLDRAGRHGYTLHRADRADAWLDPAWLQDYLEVSGHEAIPLMWEGRAFTPHDTVKVLAWTGDRHLRRMDHTGEILLREDALILNVTGIRPDGRKELLTVLGERTPGALQRFIDDYSAFARRKSREWPWIYVVGGDPLPRPRNLHWESLILPADFKAGLRGQIDSFFALEKEYHRMKLAHRRGLLLTGPPGNGKTSALRLIASDRPEPFFTCLLTDLTLRSEIDEAFDMAARDAPSILCFEDLDTLFKDDLGLSHFLNRLDGLHPLDGVLVLATTNHPEELDEALTERPSRFDCIFHFGNPGVDERRRFLVDGLGSAFDERLVSETQGFSMAQVQEVRVAACLESVQRGRSEPSIAAAFRAVERMRVTKQTARQDWEPERTIAGFHWSRSTSSSRTSPRLRR